MRPLSDKISDNLFPALARLGADTTLEHLHSLARRPPQVLLFEGGTEAARLELARYWACANLCERDERPCFCCASCKAILQDQCLEIRALDGRVSSKEEEENPGFFKSFNAENSRDLKGWLGNFPRLRYHLVFITGIAASRAEAPNALLKILEEPSKSALFVLLVPQREQILPTLVSRSLILTLPYPLDDEVIAPDVADLIALFCAFLQDKGNFLEQIGQKGFLTLSLARAFLSCCQKSLIHVLSACASSPLEILLGRLSAKALSQAIVWTQEACEMLRSDLTPVSPPRVIAAYAMRLFFFGSR
ncbi:MAG: DNA polymerase III subunit delta' [Desulfovibrio sp.]|nr:DNA polymerase III subunit delta' [Desulfovibrio sp.]